MSKVIIHNHAGIPDSEALRMVCLVIDGGRVSNEGRSYCYVTIFESRSYGRISVSTKTRRLADGEPSDSFFVWND